MLGLLKGPKGHENMTPKGKETLEPLVREARPPPEGKKATVAAQLASPVTSTTAVSPVPSVSPSFNGFQPKLVKQSSFYGRRSLSYGHKSTTNIEIVKEQYAVIRLRCHRELGASIGSQAFDTSYAGLVDWIRAERLTRLPHKGGSWDRVLIAAQYFAEQVHRLSQAIESFTPECGSASNLIFGHCLMLLELGYENAKALETTFNLFFQMGIELTPLLRAEELLHGSGLAVMEHVGRAFSELLNVITGVAVTFYLTVHGKRSSTHLDIYAVFGKSISSLRERVQLCSEEMWSVVLGSQGMDEDENQVKTLLKWLAPHDSVLAFLASDHVNLVSQPEQFTCAWFQSHLNTFLKSEDNVLLVEGEAGTGKTTLANWTTGRLQRPIGRRNVSTLSFFFNANITAQATTLDMLKTLLHQLLCQRIGDFHLFNVVYQVYTEAQGMDSAARQEERMWKAVEAALLASSDAGEPLAIIVDAVDVVETQKGAASQVTKKLHHLAHAISGVRVIQFTKQLDVPSTTTTTRAKLDVQHMTDDIHAVVRQGLRKQDPFCEKSYEEKEFIVEQLSSAFGNSMLCASLAIRYLRLQITAPAFDQAVEYITKSVRQPFEYVPRILTAAKLDGDARLLLSWLVVAKRPLALEEVSLLLQADVVNHRFTDRKVNLGPILKAIAPFIINGEGLITLRHEAIKHALIQIPGNGPVSLPLKDQHTQFVTRLLLCAKKYFQDEEEPRFGFYDEKNLDSRLGSSRLLEYAVRYWTIHTRDSSIYHMVQGSLELGKDLPAAFPSSVSFVLTEAACWKSQSFPHEAVDLMATAYHVRKAILGRDHASVLQGAIYCAVFCETVLGQASQAVEWYACAVRIGRVVLGAHTEIVLSCCTTLLRISETLVVKKRSEIMIFREEILLVLVSAHTHRFGANSKDVLEIYQKLAELYVFIAEEEKAAEIRIKIRAIKMAIHSGYSEDSSGGISRRLDVVLKKHEHGGEVDVLGGLFGYSEDEVFGEEWTIVRVETMIRVAVDLVARGEFARAEEIYLETWLKLTEHCRSVMVCEWHEKKIEVMVKYAAFLHLRKRSEEASAVLLCCWTEYSSHQVSMFESVVILLKEVAVTMKLVGMVSVALTVFQKCWSWFKSTHKEHTAIYKEIEESITITSKEIVQKTTTSSTTSKTVTAASETVIREVFESSFSSSSSSTEITSTTVELCESLTSIYMEQKRWSEAISVMKSTLKKSWASFFSESIDSVVLTSTFSSQSIEMVTKLATCYIHQRRFEKAEGLYLRLYRVHRKAFLLDDARVVKYIQTYLEFLKKHEMHSLVISFHQELLVEYRAFYGQSHAKTIQVLYALGVVCRRHNLTHGYWLEYYLEIVRSLNAKGAVVCHEDALQALIIVAEHYYETARYSESLVSFKCIVATFCQFGTKLKQFAEITVIETLLQKYYRVVEESKVEISSHVLLLKEVREACFKFFGESSSVAVSVTVVLAEVCCRSERYEFESVSYYEHILKHSKTVSSTVVKRSQSTLKSLYVKQITMASSSSSSSTVTVSKETIEKAITMSYERYVEIRETHSCTHELVLSHLKELVVLYQKQSKLELAIKELRGLVVECMTKVTSSKELIETAESIASIYVASGCVSHGFQLVRELKMQIIYGSVSKICGFNVTTVGRACFTFIASLEYHFQVDRRITMDGFMAELMAEFQFYDRFTISIKTKAKLNVVFTHAARLRKILVHSRRTEDLELIINKALDYFLTIETDVVKVSSKSSVRSFVVLLLTWTSEHPSGNFVQGAGHAAVRELRVLLEGDKYKEAFELGKCAYSYLMAHEALNDRSSITLGIQLCLLLAGRGRGRAAYPQPGKTVPDAATHKNMLELSRRILGDVIEICKTNKIDLVRCPLAELNELIALLGELKDHDRLQWLLSRLWASREGQSAWPSSVILALGRRLVQAQFASGQRAAGLALAENLVYNVRRVHGARHPQTLAMYGLLASLYTSAAQWQLSQAQTANGASANQKRAAGLAHLYFKRAVQAHEDVLRLLVDDADGGDGSDDEDDLDSEVNSSLGSSSGAKSPAGCGLSYQNQAQQQQQQQLTRREEIEAARRHIRLLRVALQRHGGWTKPAGEFGRLTTRVWSTFGDELQMKEEAVASQRWKVDGYGIGKTEQGVASDEGGFVIPTTWGIC